MRAKDLVAGAVVVAVAAGIAGASHRPRGQHRLLRDRDKVEAAAGTLTFDAISDAWARSKSGDQAALDPIRRAVPLRYVAAHEQAGTAIILTFAAHHSSCVDLISTPAANTVRTRHC